MAFKILVTGNPNYGLAEAFGKIETADFASRATGYDLSKKDDQIRLAELSLGYDVFVNNSALNDFNQTRLLYRVWEMWKENNHAGRIISIGSTIDWSRRGRAWMYSVEKKALMDASLELGTLGTWGETQIRMTYLSLGSLNTPKVAAKHPERKLMDVGQAAGYISWVINSPPEININILHLDPMQ